MTVVDGYESAVVEEAQEQASIATDEGGGGEDEGEGISMGGERQFDRDGIIRTTVVRQGPVWMDDSALEIKILDGGKPWLVGRMVDGTKKRSRRRVHEFSLVSHKLFFLLQEEGWICI